MLFDGVAWKNEYVAATGENDARNLPSEGREEKQLALIEGELGVTAAKLNAMIGENLVGGGGIGTKGVERIVEAMNWLICRRGLRGGGRSESMEEQEGYRDPHGESVDRLGGREQGNWLRRLNELDA